MAVTPTGPLSLPLANLRTLVAHCTAWQNWIGGMEGPADVARAKDRVYLVEPTNPLNGLTYTPDELKELRPFSTIDVFEPIPGRAGDAFQPIRIGVGANRWHGQLVLMFEDNLPPEDAMNAADAKIDFMNQVGGVIQEMLERAELCDYLDADDITAGLGGILIKQAALHFPVLRVRRQAEETQGDHWNCAFVIDHGL